MAETEHPNRRLVGDLVRIGAGLLFAASLAARALNKRQRASRVEATPSPFSSDQVFRNRQRRPRKPPEDGMMAPAVPPRGPLPLQGGAAAPLDFGA